VLAAELAALPQGINLTSYDADDALLDLPIASKFNGEEEFLSLLFRAGRTAGVLHGLPERARQPAGPLARSAATVVTQQ